MYLFFAREIANSEGILENDEAFHALKVLRLNEGSEILVTEGKGKVWQAVISHCTKKEMKFRTLELHQTEFSSGLHIAIAPTKSNDRFEFFLEKATEIGVERITPLLCSRSERKVYNTERGKKIIKAAVKQSQRALLPKLDIMLPYSQFLKEIAKPPLFIAHLAEENKVDFSAFKKLKKALILIGPEGDFSPEEIELALKYKAQSLNMGDYTMRTETAGIATAFAWQIR